MIKKSFLFFLLTFFSTYLFAAQEALKITWFGSTCLTVSDGVTTVLFDPFFTRPSLWQVVSFQGLKSDPEIVKKWLPEDELKKISAIVTSHSHYDHVLDLVELSKLTNAKIYGSESTRNIALGGGVASERSFVLQKDSLFSAGAFKVKVNAGEHPPHFFGLTLASGKIKSPLKPGASAFSYKQDEGFSFMIMHPQGNILFHPSGNTTYTGSEFKGVQADLVILGVANRRSSRELLEKVVKPTGASTIVPVHTDNIFTPLSKRPKNLFGIKMPDFYKSAAKYSPNSKVQTLKIGETFKLAK